MKSSDEGVAVSRRGVPLRRLGLLVSLFSAAAFVAMRMPSLPVHFQCDGQLAEYLAWSASPESIGNSFNQELNPRLFSVYYPAMAWFARYFDRLDVLRGAYAIELLLLSAAVYILGVTLARNALTGALASIAIIWGNGIAASLGGSSGVGLICNPEFPATAAICVALALSWRSRHVWAAAIAGLAFNVHGSIAVFGATMVCAAALIDGWRADRWLRAGVACVVCAVCALPTVFWVFSTPTPQGAVGMDAWMRFPHWIYPHHIFISASPLVAWFRLAVFLLPGVLGWAAMRKSYEGRLSAVQGWVFAAALLLIVGYMFVEWWPVRFVAQLTLWRGTRFLQLIALAFGIRWFLDVAIAGGWRTFAAGVAIIGYLVPMQASLAFVPHLALAALALDVTMRSRGTHRVLAAAAACVIVVMLVIEWQSLTGLTTYLAPRWGVIVIAMAFCVAWAVRRADGWRPIVVMVAAIVASAFIQRVGIVATFDGQQQRRARALLNLAPDVQSACPAGMTVVAPPDLRNPGAWADRGSFLCRQQLTVYAYGPWLADALMERMSWYLGDRELADDGPILERLLAGYRSKTTEAFETLRDQYGVGVAIVERDQHLDFGVVAENETFRVYDLTATLGDAQARGQSLE